jgi:hypothetical protein
MNKNLLLSLGLSFLLAACSGANDQPGDDNTASDSELREKSCTSATTENACLSRASGTCAWGDRGNKGSECFYVGKVVAANPSAPACSHPDVSTCLAETGCAWGDQGAGLGCFYLGIITPQPSSGCDGDAGNARCAHGTETSCLAETGCSWDGSAKACIYVGQIVPQ